MSNQKLAEIEIIEQLEVAEKRTVIEEEAKSLLDDFRKINHCLPKENKNLGLIKRALFDSVGKLYIFARKLTDNSASD